MSERDLGALGAPFPVESLDWIPVSQYPAKTKDPERQCWAPYVDARVIMDRLDEVVGPEGWQDQYEAGPHGGVMCKLSISVPGGWWVTKCDGADVPDIEPVKGGFSDAFRRAAVKWGIGRYLYHVPRIWLPATTTDKDGVVRKLRAHEAGAKAVEQLGKRLPRPDGAPASIQEARDRRDETAERPEPDHPELPSPLRERLSQANAWERGFLDLMTAAGVDFVDVATFLDCDPGDVLIASARWTAAERKSGRNLIEAVRESLSAAP